MKLGEKIAQLRKDKNMTQSELAEKMCTNWQTRSQDIYSYVFKTLL